MKIFGINFKWLETKKSKIKRMLAEEGRIKTRKLARNILYLNPFEVESYLTDLIKNGCVDRDLVKLYDLYGKWGLINKLKGTYMFNPGQIKMYIAKIENFCKENNGYTKKCV